MSRSRLHSSARLGFRQRWRAGGGGSFNKIILLPARAGVAGGGGGRGRGWRMARLRVWRTREDPRQEEAT